MNFKTTPPIKAAALVLLIVLILAAASSRSGSAVQTGRRPPAPLLKVFVDWPGADIEALRAEIPFVEFVPALDWPRSGSPSRPRALRRRGLGDRVHRPQGIPGPE